MVLLHGTELNIAPDGTVDWPADFLAGFDVWVASVHSHFDQPRSEMTRRFITACENSYVNVIGHALTARSAVGRRWMWTWPSCTGPAPPPRSGAGSEPTT
jgi:DNA polymerase (family X)